MRKKLNCDMCGKQIYRYASQIKQHNFCSRKCMSDYSSKQQNPSGYVNLKKYTNISEHCSKMNAELNPTRMTLEMRNKLRNKKLNTGTGGSYEKSFGKHTHRAVAEWALGRPLKPGEVVHHVDGNKRNNDPSNLFVFASQAEHAKWHKEHDKGGDAE